MAHALHQNKPNDKAVPDIFDREQVKAQIVSNGLVQACQVMRVGYEHRIPLGRFVVLFPYCTMRRHRNVVSDSGGFWGRTIIYLSNGARSKVHALEQHLLLKRNIRKWKLERIARRTRQKDAATLIQKRFRMRTETPVNTYRELSEFDRLREQVRGLRIALARRDAWIFRATILLKRYANNDALWLSLFRLRQQLMRSKTTASAESTSALLLQWARP